MKASTTATAPGTCAYSSRHRWPQGERVFVVQGTTWAKKYCAACAKAYHGATDDTGEILEVLDGPGLERLRAPLRALCEQVAERFDGRAAAARNDE